MKDSFPVDLLRPSIQKILREHHPELLKKKYIKTKELDEAKRIYFSKVLESVEENPASREEIVNSLLSNDFVADNINEKIKEGETLGDKIASMVANALGSWFFIISIFIVISIWLVMNTLVKGKNFDPYPFALLGLLLTAISALQAPFILNSQRNQSMRDRLKFDEDFQTNLKSELEIRNLHSKIDYYNQIIWTKLEEIQKSK